MLSPVETLFPYLVLISGSLGSPKIWFSFWFSSVRIAWHNYINPNSASIVEFIWSIYKNFLLFWVLGIIMFLITETPISVGREKINKAEPGFKLLVWQASRRTKMRCKSQGEKNTKFTNGSAHTKKKSLWKSWVEPLSYARKTMETTKARKLNKCKEQAALFFISYSHYQVPTLSLFSVWKALRVQPLY